ncbi:hypothetical protein LFX25_01600 [Leptospira sp. FAT2]|uniref:hypothetical protein n=1 Tax=Leptospira sanjuanensis TaxID=2879643 RepID=UPI001EE81901|nr:hypothetical protein [Leptospira sanjuanensis]MCG6166545.1 hypothetical protein [Leptospira sanjuanensis]MCG6191936.1 hypothetical protein [Leptospira sanjuanensis]
MRKSSIAILLIGLAFVANCSHSLKIQNLSEYYSSYSFAGKKHKIGVIINSANPAEERHAEEILQALRATGNFEVIFPYNPTASKVEYILELRPKVTYDGSRWNFLISFPGFLIFAPAWNGYKYFADIETDITIKKNNIVTKQIMIPFSLKANHSDLGRTWTQGVDWLLTLGLSSLIGGFIYTSFDSDIEGEFFRNYVNSYGKYIANKIANEFGTLN